MKIVLISVVAVMGMVLCGWLTFANSDEVVSVSIDTAEVKEDTSKAVKAGEELLEKVSEATENAAENTEQFVDETIEKSTTDEESAKPVEAQPADSE